MDIDCSIGPINFFEDSKSMSLCLTPVCKGIGFDFQLQSYRFSCEVDCQLSRHLLGDFPRDLLPILVHSLNMVVPSSSCSSTSYYILHDTMLFYAVITGSVSYSFPVVFILATRSIFFRLVCTFCGFSSIRNHRLNIQRLDHRIYLMHLDIAETSVDLTSQVSHQIITNG